MEQAAPTPPLDYATPAARPRRRWPSLSPPVAVVVIGCGTLLIATAAVIVGVIKASGHDLGDPVLLVLTGVAGFLITLLGIFFAALRGLTGDADR